MTRPHTHQSAARTCEAIVLAAIIGLSWMIARPYLGILNDALHYTALAFYRLDPSAMSLDMLFTNGHATYSIYPLVYARLVEMFGPGAAHMGAVLFGHALWMLGLFLIAIRLCERRWLATAAIVSVLLLSRSYAPQGSLIYGEMIATPRLFAEAMTLLAFGLALGRGFVVGICLCVLAAAVHPLMAGPGLLVLLSFRFGLWRGFWLPLSIGGVIGLVCAVAGIPPFSGLLAQFDATWKGIFDALFLHNALSKSSAVDLTLYMLPAASLILVAFGPMQVLARLARAVLCVVIVFCVLAVIGEALDNVLMVNLHLWRALWLLMLFGNLMAVPVLVFGLQDRWTRGLWGVTIVIAYVEPLVGHFPLAAACLSVLTLLVRFVGPRLPRLALWPFAAVITVALALVLIGFGLVSVTRFADAISADGLAMWLGMPALRLGLAVALILSVAVPSWPGIGAAALILAGCAVILPAWDARDPWRVAVERGQNATPDVAAMLEGRAVYWEGGPEVPWLVFRQASFYSCVQSAAILSDRDNAISFEERGRKLRHLNTLDFPPDRSAYCHQRPDAQRTGPQNVDDLASVCQSLDGLGVVALKAPVPGAAAIYWETSAPRKFAIPKPAELGTPPGQAYEIVDLPGAHLYDCDDFRTASEREGG